MDELIAARYNAYWYLSFIAPAAVMLVATFSHKRPLLWAGVLASVVATYILCNMAVQEKWRARFEMAKTDQELEYASADGANLAFTAFFFAPFESVLYTTLWGVLGWCAWPRVRGRQAQLSLQADGPASGGPAA